MASGSRFTARIPKSGLEYLCERADLSARLVAAVREGVEQRDEGDSVYVTLDPDTSEALRTVLTLRLAETGFDENYDPTSEGQLLEDLIDRFFDAGEG